MNPAFLAPWRRCKRVALIRPCRPPSPAQREKRFRILLPPLNSTPKNECHHADRHKSPSLIDRQIAVTTYSIKLDLEAADHHPAVYRQGLARQHRTTSHQAHNPVRNVTRLTHTPQR